MNIAEATVWGTFFSYIINALVLLFERLLKVREQIAPVLNAH